MVLDRGVLFLDMVHAHLARNEAETGMSCMYCGSENHNSQACPSRDGARSIEELIEASSLGTPEAKALREQTPPEAVQKIMDRVDELGVYVQPWEAAELGEMLHAHAARKAGEHLREREQQWRGSPMPETRLDLQRLAIEAARLAGLTGDQIPGLVQLFKLIDREAYARGRADREAELAAGKLT